MHSGFGETKSHEVAKARRRPIRWLSSCFRVFVALILISLSSPLAFSQSGAPVTFAKDVAPLLYRSCATCHRPGGSASSTLLTFDAARQHARQIADLTASRRMPPWKPEPGYGEFDGSRRLTDAEIDVFRRWLADGLREGDRADLPPAPEFPRGWELGEPDLVLTMPAYTLRAGGPDMFRNFVVPVASAQMRYVRAWEFHPGNARVVHHATLQIDASGASRRYDEQDKESGYEGLIAPSARAPDGFFLDWAPGHRPSVAPDGIAWSLPPSSDLVMMLHLRPSGKEEQVQASIGLYFAKDTPTRIPTMLRLTKQDLDFPANVPAQRVTDSFTVPIDVDLLTVQPHAHYLARDLRGFARLPDGSLQPLIHIADWDFDWQDVYRFVTPVFLPAGSTLVMEYTYDNSPANPRNPNTPPRRVTYGQQTSDEMAELWFQAVPRDPRARATLNRRVYEKILPAEIDGRRMMLARDPRNVALHDDLALLYSDANQPRAAVDEFKASLALRPESAAARYNVGAALLAAGDRLAAREYLEAALLADANHARAHSSLAVILDAAGDHATARTHHAQALRLEPGNADIQLSAGVGFAMAGDRAQAVDHLVEALRLQPDWPNAMAALASVMTDDPQATMQSLRMAVALAERAVELSARGNPAFVEILDAARVALERAGR